MLNYNQFFEGKSSRLEYSEYFILKKLAESKNGKTALYGFEIKNQKHEIWIPLGAIYSSTEHELPDLSEDYKSLRLAHFIYSPESHEQGYAKRKAFFDAYNKFMLPVVKRLEYKKEKSKEDELVSSFKDAINRMVPDVSIGQYDKKTNSISTNIGDFYIHTKNPLSFKIGSVYLTMEEDGVMLNYNNQFYIKGLGKDGLVVKAMIKTNSGQPLNAVEVMALKRIYKDSLKRHDWYTGMSDDPSSRKAGDASMKRISNLKHILKSIGEDKYAEDTYKEYEKTL